MIERQYPYEFHEDDAGRLLNGSVHRLVRRNRTISSQLVLISFPLTEELGKGSRDSTAAWFTCYRKLCHQCLQGMPMFGRGD